MTVEKVTEKMIEYYSGDAKRINHFMKVYSYAKTIGRLERLPEEEQLLLEIAALTHDIGIKASEEKYQSTAGKYQELEGPSIAEEMLLSLGFDKAFTDKVCYLIARHHTYTNINSASYQILVEADFIVNIYEDGLDAAAVEKIKDKIFRTKSGAEILNYLYLAG